jgi:hypothetical protein
MPGSQGSECICSLGRFDGGKLRQQHVNTVGEPCEGKPRARFDEGRLARRSHAEPVAYSPPLRGAKTELEPLTCNGNPANVRTDGRGLTVRLSQPL